MKPEHKKLLRVTTGWVGKTEKKFWRATTTYFPGTDVEFTLYRSAGPEEQWEPEDWPPRKVRITVEEL